MDARRTARGPLARRRCLRAKVYGAASIVAMLALAGCYTPKGGWLPSSTGAITYYSTESMGKTITMMDLRTNEPFFMEHIPAGHQLTVQFLKGGGDDPLHTPDRMLYGILPLGTMTGNLPNQMTVPPSSARRIDVEVSQDVRFAEVPDHSRLRTDSVEERPDYWSPRGGERPVPKPSYDD